eukprot:snap_masked-scaffold_93-processed-gene-0.3-mRNA-1 protein AED:1.00 eAED:1.00 QI:0/0/0/0/1/1/2/0/267
MTSYHFNLIFQDVNVIMYCNLASTTEDRRPLETLEEVLVFQYAPDSGLEESFLSGNSSQISESLAEDVNHHHLSSQNENSESTFLFTRFDHLLTVLKNEDPSSKDLNDAFEFLAQLPRKESSLNISEFKLFLKSVNLLCNSYNQGPSTVKLFRLLCLPKLAFNPIVTKNKLDTLQKFSTDFPHKLDASVLHSAFNTELSSKKLDLKTTFHHLLKLKNVKKSSGNFFNDGSIVQRRITTDIKQELIRKHPFEYLTHKKICQFVTLTFH